MLLIPKETRERVINGLLKAKNRISTLSDNEMVRLQEPKNKTDVKLESDLAELAGAMVNLSQYIEPIIQKVTQEEKEFWRKCGRIEVAYLIQVGKKIEVNTEQECLNATQQLNEIGHLDIEKL
jgi:hypothetical protein